MSAIKLTSFIVDDEKPSSNLLQMMLRDLCPEVELIGEAENIYEARWQIEKKSPDILFLDIEMPDANGFELLKYVNHDKTSIVFVTAYSKYAVNAIKAGAEDYILKPIDSDELKFAVKKVYQSKINAVVKHIPFDQRLMLPHHKGLKMVDTKNIIRLKADNNYTEIFLDDGHKIVVSKPIKDFEYKLDDRLFYRIHKSHMINLNHFREYSIKDGLDYAIMDDGSEVSISRLKVVEFLNHLSRFATGL